MSMQRWRLILQLQHHLLPIKCDDAINIYYCRDVHLSLTGSGCDKMSLRFESLKVHKFDCTGTYLTLKVQVMITLEMVALLWSFVLNLDPSMFGEP